jgi:hypothetical protein
MEMAMKKLFLMTTLLFAFTASASDSQTSSGVSSPVKGCFDSTESLEATIETLVIHAGKVHPTTYEKGCLLMHLKICVQNALT